MKIVIGNDHAGVALKNHLLKTLSSMGYEAVNVGTDTTDSVNYPEIAEAICAKVIGGECDCGIAICGTGLGISIACNKVAGIRCAVCSEVTSATMARHHNNANVLALGARMIGEGAADAIVEAFLTNSFDGGRHQNRVDMITRLEQTGTCKA